MADGRLHCSVHSAHQRSFFGSRWRPREQGLLCAAIQAVLCEQRGHFFSQNKIEGSSRCVLDSSLRIDLDLRVRRWRERAPEREEVLFILRMISSWCIADSVIKLHIILSKRNMSYNEKCTCSGRTTICGISKQILANHLSVAVLRQ